MLLDSDMLDVSSLSVLMLCREYVLLTISLNQSPIGTCLNVIYLPSNDNKGYPGGHFDGLLGVSHSASVV
jgi:hypothetical protein